MYTWGGVFFSCSCRLLLAERRRKKMCASDVWAKAQRSESTMEWDVEWTTTTTKKGEWSTVTRKLRALIRNARQSKPTTREKRGQYTARAQCRKTWASLNFNKTAQTKKKSHTERTQTKTQTQTQTNCLFKNNKVGVCLRRSPFSLCFRYVLGNVWFKDGW